MTTQLIILLVLLLLVNLNAAVGWGVSKYIEKSRESELGFKELGIIRKYLAFQFMALLFYAMAGLYFITGKHFRKVM